MDPNSTCVGDCFADGDCTEPFQPPCDSDGDDGDASHAAGVSGPNWPDGVDGWFQWCGRLKCVQTKCFNFAVCREVDGASWFDTRTAPVCQVCDMTYGALLRFPDGSNECPVCLESGPGHVLPPGCGAAGHALCVPCFRRMVAVGGRNGVRCPLCPAEQPPPPWALRMNGVSLEQWLASRRAQGA